MRRLLAAALFVLASSSAALADGWTTFTDATGVVSLDVPQQPTYSSEKTTGANGQVIDNAKYLIDGDTVAMLLMIGDFSGRNIDPENALNMAVQGTQSEGRTLVSDNAVTVDGHTGRDIKLTDQSGDSLRDVLFFFNDHLYQVITVTTPGATQDQAAEAQRYSASLHFLH